MRTTIEMKPEHRAKLLEAAAERGEKGFSGVVAEAIDEWLKSRRSRDQVLRRALALKGSFSTSEAAELEAETVRLRNSWR